ncbi:PLP-dependent aminotransferase family protein [Microbulbifer elongatus]|uniref:PLP-dependent aminotransferase family protein n=1 Tax=Microbulbifer elongatus TaxID=86173 RepID=A0ABT1P4B7_9GAMM|nr:PLP-dependent aminotransferase family protein [Microbulbifer elongatus]MCQ3830952.1 PLP-dependent aminotransferase family protein [Microbulbifer elongatus]
MGAQFRYEALETWLEQGIREQRWGSGERLPSIRALCREHGLSKATVQHALQRLESRGLIETRPKAGHFVAVRPLNVAQPVSRARIEPPRPVTVNELLLDIMGRNAAFDLLPALHETAPPPGIVALNRAIARALRRPSQGSYQYYDAPAGDIGLREQLTVGMARRGCRLGVDALCITSGCQNALFLALMASCSRGDIVAVESPGFYGVMQLLEHLELQVIEIPSAVDWGMDLEALHAVLQRWPVRACIVSPSFATPGGALMPDAAKQRLLALADEFDLAVIEDDIYGDTGFTSVPDPLKGMDRYQRVILCSSFSKSLSRDLRLGWISGARWHDRILQIKLVTQLAGSRSVQQGVAAFLADGGYAAHLRRERGRLREQRDQLRTMLDDWPGDVRVSVPDGGLAVWVELPEGIDTLAAYPRALAQGVVITPGPLFSASGQFGNCLRLSFAHPWSQARRQALAVLPEIFGLTPANGGDERRPA